MVGVGGECSGCFLRYSRPNLIRTICLVFAVLVAAATFHRTRFANRQWKRTTLAVLLFIIVAAGLFLGAGYFDHFAEKRATADSGTVKEPQIQSSLSAEQIAEEIAKKLPRPTHEKEIVEQHTIKPTVTAVVGRHSDIPRNSPTLQTHERPPTLSDLFNGDFSNAARVADKEFDFKWSDGTASHIKPQTYLDFPAKTEFIGFYVSASKIESETKSFNACLQLAEAVEQIIDDLPKHHDFTGGYIGERTTLRELTFSGRVFLYHEDFLSIPQKADIIKAYSRRGLDVQFRGPDYLAIQMIAWHREHDKKQ